MEDNPITCTLLKGGKKRVELPLGFSAKPRNPRARLKKVKKGGKAARLIRTLRFC